MRHRSITINVPEFIVDKAERAVDADLAESVSAYFTRLAERDPDWASAQTEGGGRPQSNVDFMRSDEQWMRALHAGGGTGHRGAPQVP